MIPRAGNVLRDLLDGLSAKSIEERTRYELLMSLRLFLHEAIDANQDQPRVLAVLDWLAERAGVPNWKE